LSKEGKEKACPRGRGESPYRKKSTLVIGKPKTGQREGEGELRGILRATPD